SDLNGNYFIGELQPGTYNLEVSVVGFKRKVVPEVSVQNARPTSLDIRLEEDQATLSEVEVVASPFTKTTESPLSVRTVGIAEIQRNPGGNRDISKVIQSLPGVAAVPSFRNDIIIRGGAPSENRFYLDGIEVPNINHFATQGASGGPVGLINVNFIRQVDFYSSAFPAARGNALSSVLEFQQKEGRDVKIGYTILAGSSDLGLTVDGPISPKSTFIFSARRSYLQFLFKALQLPFLPTYNDAQFKTTINLNPKNKITILGLGAIDEFELNKSANETELQQYLLNNLPVNEQWNYTVGAKYEHFRKKSNQTWVISRNHLNNSAIKYRNNNEDDADALLLDYQSEEIENKFRLEEFYSSGGYTLSYGVNYEFATYRNRTFNRISTPQGLLTEQYKTDLNLHKYGAFGQVAKELLNNRLSLSGGFRIDGNSFSADMWNPLEQLSPRVALSYQFLPRWSFNASTGRYFQLPAYT
ncbi:MAG: TonB-dependent receptor, partial [Hymenobacteraceae bacterium]|nr:TonB-dependent receptor [Hymenobacteraceae bacterium]